MGCRSGHDGYATPEPLELADAPLATHTHHFVVTIQGMLHHVLTERPRCPTMQIVFILVRCSGLWHSTDRIYREPPGLRRAGPLLGGHQFPGPFLPSRNIDALHQKPQTERNLRDNRYPIDLRDS